MCLYIGGTDLDDRRVLFAHEVAQAQLVAQKHEVLIVRRGGIEEFYACP